MTDAIYEEITLKLSRALDELQEQAAIPAGGVLAVGTSTSEVKGEKIGSAGSTEIAAAIWQALKRFAEKNDVYLAFQGCEHINRALTVSREYAERERLSPVTVVPVPQAGGSMAAYAYRQMDEPAVVEEIQADAGIDIGDTLIGMQLKSVAVPVRTSVETIGNAHVTYARTRPKLIGGARAEYR
ncbi:TIGR01440 family protein [Salisediminibacterium halotolerans]|uniref:UPF0340 protein SAMN05444126_103110 n=1 Tax=Salisediminibacterium halotolerans TaxID=517425 RepID=A0A1H9QRN2_9BACI|nr:TIGR01440 family protein [Salisediminibacterium haloalkalitolerans]SER62895.1 TIGR01440 family protein [Salisediminibacterium haloalkalitolerans]